MNGEHPPPEQRWVTNAELKAEIVELREEIRERPTRWETRYLIILAVTGAVVIPQIDFARSGAGAILGWFT